MVELLPRVAQELVTNHAFVGIIVTSIDQSVSQKLEERMQNAGDKAEIAFKLLEDNLQTTEMANHPLKRLESGGSQIAKQHDEIENALQNMNTKMETTRAELNQDSHDMK